MSPSKQEQAKKELNSISSDRVCGGAGCAPRRFLSRRMLPGAGVAANWENSDTHSADREFAVLPVELVHSVSEVNGPCHRGREAGWLFRCWLITDSACTIKSRDAPRKLIISFIYTILGRELIFCNYVRWHTATICQSQTIWLKWKFYHVRIKFILRSGLNF